MDKELKTKLQSKEQWSRLGYMFLYSIILLLSTWCLLIVGIIAIIQFILKMFSGNPNKQLLAFSEKFSLYIYQLVSYITFVSEEKPFPIGTWPKVKSND